MVQAKNNMLLSERTLVRRRVLPLDLRPSCPEAAGSLDPFVRAVADRSRVPRFIGVAVTYFYVA